jgi:adenylate cyclase class 2
MAAIIEREIKLRFESAEAARAAVAATGATSMRARRLQEDCLLDTRDEIIHRRRCVLRVRIESGKSLLTFKGPVQPSTMKVREELETIVGDGPLLLRVLEELGFEVWFQYQKYREEFVLDDVIVAVDETPLGAFVEIEGSASGISDVAEKLGRQPAEYLVDSYRQLYVAHCQRLGRPITHMLFDDEPGD